MAASPSRRRFLKASLLGTLVLATAGGVYRALQPPKIPSPYVLDGRAESVLRALVPVILHEAISPASIGAVIQRVQQAIAGLPLATQEEVRDLFGLLNLAPTRRFLAGLSQDWPEAAPDDIAAFLQSWRTHRFSLFQGAYQALHDLITGSWYSDESAWAAIGYPGPLKELR